MLLKNILQVFAVVGEKKNIFLEILEKYYIYITKNILAHTYSQRHCNWRSVFGL